MAGRLKRENPQINEDIVLIRALRDANVPKFLSDDLVLFKVGPPPAPPPPPPPPAPAPTEQQRSGWHRLTAGTKPLCALAESCSPCPWRTAIPSITTLIIYGDVLQSP